MSEAMGAQKESSKNFPYEDIIELPHFKNPERREMPPAQRAAQFMPFKSLNEYDQYVFNKTDELKTAMDENYEILYD
ncbi:MAG: hypothetical protein Q4B87_03060 [Candidatus Saccharibacteria bacterium]|nr:hypothetical protein [Candidatus Saccharibacteria bacterium]